MSVTAPTTQRVHYPESDGEPMADNTIQFRWISILKWNLEHLFANDSNAFVAGDHLIYPIEGDIVTRMAPDVYVAFGPAKGDRGCYKVFEEGGIFPQVVFEVWSPGNRTRRMEEKRGFYEKFGAEEYYIVYPEEPAGLEGWLLRGNRFIEVPEMNRFISPRLGIRFELGELDIRMFGPDGREFLSPAEIAQERDEAERSLRSEKADKDKFAAKLRELGVDPDSL